MGNEIRPSGWSTTLNRILFGASTPLLGERKAYIRAALFVIVVRSVIAHILTAPVIKEYDAMTDREQTLCLWYVFAVWSFYLIPFFKVLLRRLKGIKSPSPYLIAWLLFGVYLALLYFFPAEEGFWDYATIAAECFIFALLLPWRGATRRETENYGK